MKISIVIPVYNEEERLAACLRAIAAQAVRPHEVIVVDNNSTDGSAAVAAGFSFVTLLSERRQGVVHARDRGFGAASGDIIGRIDADSLLPADWTARIQAIFADPAVSAVSGSANYYDFAWEAVADKLDAYFRSRLARKLKTDNFLWGANMAVRRASWLKIRRQLCGQAGMHEDFDLAIHLQAAGLKVIYEPVLAAGVSSRRVDTNFLDYVRYTMVSPKTYALHGLASRRHMYPVLVVCWLGYLPARFVYRAFDPATGKFSWSRLLALAPGRVDPTTNTV